jgi:hypothetical protein
MSQTEGNYVPKTRAPFLWYPEPKPSVPSIDLIVKDPKKPLGFADWPEDPRPEWKKA